MSFLVDGGGQLTQQLLGIAQPIQASVMLRDRGQRIGLTFDRILTLLALHHDAEHGLAATGDLLADIGADFHLLLVLLGAIGMAKVHHHLLRQTGLGPDPWPPPPHPPHVELK